ncbi:MAG TPA: polysaccharide deacetylase, partial [Clostridiales bacterium]|nr:polysaccharide deacetylase [Clostridiales bacterium]
LQISVDGTIIFNPAAMDVWVTWNGKPVMIRGGSMAEMQP